MQVKSPSRQRVAIARWCIALAVVTAQLLAVRDEPFYLCISSDGHHYRLHPHLENCCRNLAKLELRNTEHVCCSHRNTSETPTTEKQRISQHVEPILRNILVTHVTDPCPCIHVLISGQPTAAIAPSQLDFSNDVRIVTQAATEISSTCFVRDTWCGSHRRCKMPSEPLTALPSPRDALSTVVIRC